MAYDIVTFCIIMTRPKEQITIERNILPNQYQLLVKKIEYFSEYKDKENIIFVFDEVNAIEDEKNTKGFNHFLYTSAQGKKFKHVLGLPLFVSSAITPMIQIADIFARIVRKYYEEGLNEKNPQDDYEKRLSQLYNKIYNKTINFAQPCNEQFYEYGFQEINNLNYIKK